MAEGKGKDNLKMMESGKWKWDKPSGDCRTQGLRSGAECTRWTTSRSPKRACS